MHQINSLSSHNHGLMLSISFVHVTNGIVVLLLLCCLFRGVHIYLYYYHIRVYKKKYKNLLSYDILVPGLHKYIIDNFKNYEYKNYESTLRK